MSKFVYLIQNVGSSKYKVGISKNPNKRIKQLQTSCDDLLKLINVYESDNASKIETTLHNRYQIYNSIGEWFDLSISEEVKFLDECAEIDKNIKILKINGNIFI